MYLKYGDREVDVIMKEFLNKSLKLETKNINCKKKNIEN